MANCVSVDTLCVDVAQEASMYMYVLHILKAVHRHPHPHSHPHACAHPHMHFPPPPPPPTPPHMHTHACSLLTHPLSYPSVHKLHNKHTHVYAQCTHTYYEGLCACTSTLCYRYFYVGA